MLLFLTLTPILLFISFSTYYDNKLKNTPTDNDKEIPKGTGKAVLGQANETTRLEDTFQKDKKFFEEKYADLSSESEALRQDRVGLEAELNSAKSELENTKASFDKLQSKFKQVQDSLIKANEQISSLIARNQELCRKLEEKGGEC